MSPWVSWWGVVLGDADGLPVVVRFPAGPRVSLSGDPPKGNGRRPKKDRLPVVQFPGSASKTQDRRPAKGNARKK